MASRNHHYVPQFVLRAFARADASDVLTHLPVSTRARIRSADEHVLANGGKHVPVVVMDTTDGTLSRSTTRKTFASRGLYDVGADTDEVVRGIMRQTLHCLRTGARLDLDFDELVALGTPEFEPDEVERLDTAALDGDFASLSGRFHARGSPSTDSDLERLLRYHYFARVRTPWFRDRMFGPLAVAAVLRVVEREAGELARMERDHLVPRGQTMAEVIESLFRQQYMVMMAKFRTASMAEAVASPSQVVFAHSSATPFVLGDNPARCCLADQAQSILRDTVRQYGDPGSLSVLPLSPTLCMLVIPHEVGPRVSHVDLGPCEVRHVNAVSLASAVEAVVLPQTTIAGLFPPDVSMVSPPPQHV